jgi:hypothetical protein
MAKQNADLRDMFENINTHHYTQLPTDPLRGEDIKQLLAWNRTAHNHGKKLFDVFVK